MKNILVTIAVFLACLLVGEGALRVVYPHGVEFELPSSGIFFPWLKGDALVGWKNRPGHEQKAFSINLHGMRGPEFVHGKDSNRVRVFCLGDSRTFGVWSNAHNPFVFNNSYVPHVQNALAKSKVEVWNLGVVGYTSGHALRQLNTQVSNWAPDVVTVAVGFNDLLLSWDTGLRAAEPEIPLLRGLLYAFGDWRITQLVLRAVQTDPNRAEPMTERWVNLEQYRRNLMRIVETVEELGIRLLLIHLPIRAEQLGPLKKRPNADNAPMELMFAITGTKSLAEIHQTFRQYRDVLFEVAEKTGVPLLDLSGEFAPRAVELFGAFDMVHYNPTGAEVAGTAIARRLNALGWVSLLDQ